MTLLHQAAQKAVEAMRALADMFERHMAFQPKSVVGLCVAEARDAIAQLESALQQQRVPVALAQDHPAPGWYWISVEGAEPVPARIWREFDSLPNSRLLFVPFGTFAPKNPRDWRHERECRAPEERNAALCIVAPIPLYTAPPALQQHEVPREPVAWQAQAQSFFEHIAHGDEKHREWLKRETDVWFRDRAASPSTTRQQEAGSETSQAPLTDSERDQIARGVGDRIEQFIAERNRAAAPSTPENAGGVPEGVPGAFNDQGEKA